MISKLNLAGFTAEYAIDIPEIDEQHESVFTMMSKIGEVVTDPYRPLDEDEVDDMVDLLYELREFALLHFTTEEAYMSEVDFPALGDQQQAHSRFITDVTRMEAELMNGSSIPAIKVQSFLHDWYRDHILSMDKPFGEFYAASRK